MSVTSQSETLAFEAQVDQVLHLVTHALYSNKEIFLRELISNASDAIDKLRFGAIGDEALLESDTDYKITVSFDAKAKTITIRDNGIGMSREEVIENLGKIAKSGTQDFLKRLTGDQAKDVKLIGQFGVGFYSAFIVADQVTVKTRRAGMKTDQGVVWTSEGKSQYTIENAELEKRGTEITLQLKAEEEEFLNEWRLSNIITKYSDHIPVPIILLVIDEKGTVEEKVVNKATALWTLSKNEVKTEEYETFYQSLTHDFEKPLAWTHHRVEGKLDYVVLVYLPGKAPFDLFTRQYQRGLKLYVQRVFIMDSAEQLLPLYLRFVRGVVDSNDFPLNVSRELLQSSKVVDAIRANCTKKTLDLLEKLATEEPEKYATFWREFGAIFKEGVSEDFANKERITKLVRFASTHNEENEPKVTLQDYVSRMKPKQDKIYYLCAEDYAAAMNSPHLEIFKQKGVEVLLLTDRVDEWFVAHVTEFEGKTLQSVSKGSLGNDVIEAEGEQPAEKPSEAEFESLLKELNTVLAEHVKEVRSTKRLTDSPACLVSEEGDMSSHLKRILQEAGQSFEGSKPILEINLSHPLLKRLNTEADPERLKEWALMLFDQALLAEGGKLKDPGSFIKRMNRLMVEV